MLISTVCFAGGCLPGENCGSEPVPLPARKRTMVEPVRSIPPAACEGWGSRFAAGAPIWFFDEESTEIGGGIYYDLYSRCLPLNLRLGAEVNHMGADQPNALASAEKPGSDARLTFIRIPFAVEYMTSVEEDTIFFAGLGPDIIHTANDIEDTSVGMHISTRILHNFTENWGAAIEAGYMWGEVNDGHGDVTLDNAFIIPTLSYSF